MSNLISSELRQEETGKNKFKDSQETQKTSLTKLFSETLFFTSTNKYDYGRPSLRFKISKKVENSLHFLKNDFLLFIDQLKAEISYDMFSDKEITSDETHLTLDSEKIAKLIKESVENFSSDIHVQFLATFQICLELPSIYQTRAWNTLKNDFKNIDSLDSHLAKFIHTFCVINKYSIKQILPCLNLIPLLNLPEVESHIQTKSRMPSPLKDQIVLARVFLELTVSGFPITLQFPFNLTETKKKI